MRLFNVDVSFVFEGYCEVKAKSLEEAKEIARENLRAWGAQISDSQCDKITFYESDLHADTIVKEK